MMSKYMPIAIFNIQPKALGPDTILQLLRHRVLDVHETRVVYRGDPKGALIVWEAGGEAL